MSAEIEFRGGPAYIRFRLLGQPYADIPGYLPTTVTVDTGVFRGACTTHTAIEGWLGLRAALVGLAARVQDAEVQWSLGDEVGVELYFQQTKLGHLRLRTEIQLQEQDATLRFWMDADQTYLTHWIAAIDEALAQLPAA